MLAGRRIVLGVTGGVAAFKAAYLARRLIESGASVRVVMTRSALEFLGPQTMAAITGEPPLTDLFGAESVSPHTDLAAWAEVVVVAPATAATLARMASGESDDLLVATILAFTGPVVVAPAMHTEMWEHPATRRNMAVLADDGVRVVGPASGALAGGDEGPGRMVEPEEIVTAVVAALGGGDLMGWRVLVSAGGTREPVDPVRFIGNRSSGKMGNAIAMAAARRGAAVSLVTTVAAPSHPGITVVPVETSQEMAEAVWAQAPGADVAVLAAAVADFRPAAPAAKKLRRAAGPPDIALEPTPDILAGVAAMEPRPFLVGFAAETGATGSAASKVAAKGVDVLVANDVTAPGVGFGTDTNAVTVFTAGGSMQDWPLQSKEAIADRLWDLIVEARVALTGAVRVVPDVPSFAVDDGFAYAVPEGMSVTVGSVVRVPLGGRRVRGWVVATGEPPRPGLRAILGRSGDIPVCDARLLGVLRWAAIHYLAPLAAMLAKATPPNIARGEGPGPGGGGLRQRPRLVVGPEPWHDSIAAAVAAPLQASRSVLIVAPTVPEAESLAVALGERLGRAVAAVSSQSGGAAVTARWIELATIPGSVLVGTRETAAWPIAAPGLVVIAGEGRRGMKDKATPTVHARDLLLRRAVVERFGVMMTEHVPTAEALSRTPALERTGRPWGLVELVDRRADPPGTGLIASATAAALRAAVGRRVLLFTHRRAAAQRCVRCRLLRRCPSCGAAPGEATVCPRCGAATDACSSCGGRRFETLGAPVPRVLAEASRIVPRDLVGVAGSGRPFVVGTERDLPGLVVDLTVVLDGDGPLMAPSYRAGEDGLRLLGRAVAAAGTGRGRRGIIQTGDPDHPAFAALRDGDPVGFVRSDAARRAALGFPPGGEILVVEVTGEIDPGELAATIGNRAAVHGPAPTPAGRRWLVQAVDLGAARIALRGLVGRWREAGVRVRVDVDPMDL